jgi:putative two-component system response regulator
MDAINLPMHRGQAVARMKILIIDDEPANAALLEGLLAVSGYSNVKSITDSRLAIATCQSFEPDLLLLDLTMPHIDGFAVLNAIRSELGDLFLPVIVLTADVSEKTKLRALRASANDFLTKPFDQTEVLVRISNLLETRRLHQLLDNQRAAFEDAVRVRSAELRSAILQLELVKKHSANAIIPFEHRALSA